MATNDMEPKTTFTATVVISSHTTAGKAKNERGYYDIEVPSRSETIVEWTSTKESLDDLINLLHHMVKLHGGTIGFIIDEPRRGLMAP